MTDLRISTTETIRPNYGIQDKEEQEKGALAAGLNQAATQGNALSSPLLFPSSQPATIEGASLGKQGLFARALARIAAFVSLENEEATATNEKMVSSGIPKDYIRPELDKPSPFAQDTFKKMVEDATEDKIGRLSEAEIERMIIAANRHQIDGYEEDVRVQMDESIQKMHENDSLKDKYLELKKEAEEKQNSSTLFNWTSISTGIVGGALAVGGVVTALVTGGAAIPLVLAAGAAVAAVSGGATQIAGSVLKYQGNKHEGDAIRTREERGLNKDSIQVKLQNMQTTENTITELHKNARRIISNKPHIFDGLDES